MANTINMLSKVFNKSNHEEKIYRLTEDELADIRKESVQDGVDTAFALMLAIPVMVLHDHDWKASRTDIPKFIELCMNLYDSYDMGYVSFNDLITTLEEESGIKMIKSDVGTHVINSSIIL